MIRRPPRSTPLYSSAASDVYKRQRWRHSFLCIVSSVTIKPCGPRRVKHHHRRDCGRLNSSSTIYPALSHAYDTASPLPCPPVLFSLKHRPENQSSVLLGAICYFTVYRAGLLTVEVLGERQLLELCVLDGAFCRCKSTVWLATVCTVDITPVHGFVAQRDRPGASNKQTFLLRPASGCM